MSEDLEARLESAAPVGELKDEQRKVVLSFVCGNDVFVSLPTGYGMSVCFAVLNFLFDHITGVRSGVAPGVRAPPCWIVLESFHKRETCFAGGISRAWNGGPSLG